MTEQTDQRVRVFLWLGYAAIIILGVFERIPLIDPPSLWYDDEWVGALVRWTTFSDLFVYQASAPMGFVAALKGFTSIESDSSKSAGCGTAPIEWQGEAGNPKSTNNRASRGKRR